MLRPNNFRVTAVAASLVTLAEVKTQLHLFEDDFDAQLMTTIIPAATQLAAQIMGEFPYETELSAYYPMFDTNLELPQNEVTSIASIEYRDELHATVILPTTDWIFDDTSRPTTAHIITNSIPQLSDRFANPVTVNYVAGFDEDNITPALNVAITILAADMFNNRETYVNGAGLGSRLATVTAERLLAPFKRVAV